MLNNRDDIIKMIQSDDFFTETRERSAIYEERLIKKNWQAIWHMVKVHY